MGMSSGSRGGEINVTPLIDILLVLLVIFLVAMPVVLRSEHVEVPPHDDSAMPSEPVVAIAIHADLTYSIDDGAPLTASALPAALASHLAAAHAVLVAADDGVAWHDVVATIDQVNAMDGVERVALATKP
jgi:biopolymer transport protein ExbD